MKILFVTSECAPFSKSGGLADVAYSLPPALKEEGNEIDEQKGSQNVHAGPPAMLSVGELIRCPGGGILPGEKRHIVGKGI